MTPADGTCMASGFREIRDISPAGVWQTQSPAKSDCPVFGSSPSRIFPLGTIYPERHCSVKLDGGSDAR
jgi:hypothetical protein